MKGRSLQFECAGRLGGLKQATSRLDSDMLNSDRHAAMPSVCVFGPKRMPRYHPFI